MDTPVRLLVVDPDAANLMSVASLAEEEGIEVRTAVDANGAIRQCRLGYLDLVMIDSGADGTSGVMLLQTIRTLRPTVRAVLMHRAHAEWPLQGTSDGGLESVEKPLRRAPFRQILRKLRSEPRHMPDSLDDVSIGRRLWPAPGATRTRNVHS